MSLRMLQTKNKLIEASYNKISIYHTVLKEQNNKLSDALQLANIDMNVAIGSKKNFLAVISHELMTPLTTIMGFAELLSLSDMPQNKKMKSDILWMPHINCMKCSLRYCRISS